jgi:ketosteroid isomerase-like protein
MLAADPSDNSEDHAWWTRLFTAVDSGDARLFTSLLDADARFRFGNAPALVGSHDIEAGVAGFFAAIASSRHTFSQTWRSGGAVACEGEVTYTRHDGSTVGFPFVNVLELAGDRICDYRIYIDLGPLFGPAV